MADIAVSFAIDQLLPLLREEASLLRGIHKEFQDIKNELDSIQAFLKDADRRATEEGDNIAEGVTTWVKQVREAAFRIEDIIDEYMIYVGQQPRDSGCVAALTKISHFIKTLIPRHRIASEIQEIKSDVRGITDTFKRYDFQREPSSFEHGSSSSRRFQNVQWHDPRFASLYIEEADLVGFEAPRKELIGWLIEGPKNRAVIAVVGMGGQGKTTLAKKVFDSKKVVEHFECHAWITVSQSYTVERLLRDMLCSFMKVKSVPQRIRDMDRNALTEEVRDYLKQKRYIVVFDDVWDVELWSGIEFTVLDNECGSRVIITTRHMDVARFCRTTSSLVRVHELHPLSFEKSLELFYKKAFQYDFNGCCPKDLVNISSKIVKKCDGLPLAIVVIGCLLSSKEKTEVVWERFSQNLSLELETNSRLSSITKILGFSYDDLPYYLKSCFLYFGIYPEDCDVKARRLIRQWIAEGFIRFEKGKTLEEVAEEYLGELIGRNLIQASSFTIDGRAKTYRVHDLLRETILKKSRDLSFSRFFSGDDEPISSNGIVRRLSIGTSPNDLLQSIESSHVRSLHFFTKELITEETQRRIFTKYKSLKVLDFEDGHEFVSFYDNMEKLVQLKYLSFRQTGVKRILPTSMGKLQNLETLNLRYSEFKHIPKEISTLKKLRHLLGHHLVLIGAKDYIGGMTSLQTLQNVKVSDEDGEEVIRELGKLRQMRKLGLVEVKKEQGSTLCSSLNKMQLLEKLEILAYYDDEVIDLSSVSSMPKLKKLFLRARLNKLPEWIPKLQNLVKLTLVKSKLTEDPAKSLQNMPSLLCLNIGDDGYEGESLHFEDGGFGKLKELHLEDLTNLATITIDQGALQSLIELYLQVLPNLKMAPSGINHLKKLEVITTNLQIPLLDPHTEQEHPIKIIQPQCCVM